MSCPFCEHPNSHKHGQTSKGSQRFRCPNCKQTFTDTFDTLFYRRQVTPEQAETILQAHAEGSSLRGISRIGRRAYGTVVSLVRDASQKAQQVHNQEVQAVESEKLVADEMWSFVKKKQKHCWPGELEVGDCWIALSLAKESGLIVIARVGKHTDELTELVANTEGKTDCKLWYTDDWGGYERVLPPEMIHIIGKQNTQRLERTNGIIRQHTGR